MSNSGKEKLLFHTCCAPCSGFLVQKFSQEYQIEIYFDNSNIYPKEEYFKRINEAKKYFDQKNIKLIETKYDHISWLKFIQGLEDEPERGGRCEKCYLYRLENTARYAKDNNYDAFASTLAISPHKDAVKLNQIGKELSQKYQIKFIAGDWKKQDGFKKAMELSHQEGFYHQNYCGCEFSIRS